MIRLATSFSGIGAIEHALERMNLDHKIVFACDTGDVDILSQSVDIDINSVEHEIISLKETIGKINIKSSEDEDYVKELVRDYNKVVIKFDKERELFTHVDTSFLQIEKTILLRICEDEKVKKTRLKEYNQFLQQLEQRVGVDRTFIAIRYGIKIISDFTKDNPVELLKELDPEVLLESKDNISWYSVYEELVKLYQVSEEREFKKVFKRIKAIAESLSMLHERINTFHITKELDSIEDYEEKKKYVDNLYAGKESQNKVKQSYMANYDIDEKDFHWNVSFLDGTQYTNQVDLFVGGSPCQSFSLVGKQRGLEDTRGTLFYEYARLVKEIKPKVFIYENVKALLTNDNGRTWETMQQVFADLDYTWYQDVLNAKDYGIPQNRERVFVVGFRNDLKLEEKFSFPEPIELEKTMQDFLLDNVSGKYYLPKKGVDFVTKDKNLTKRFTQIDGTVQLCQKKNQQFNWHGDFVFVEENHDKEKTMQDLEKYFLSEKVRKYVMATGTKSFYSKPQTDLEIARPLLTTMHKMHRAGVDNYVTTEGRLRKLTPRECLRLMGFCDSFDIVVSDTSMYQQAGNSIVVDVLMAIMGKIIESYPTLIQEEK
ncbi:DNA cytosine methyltransferase [Kurthia gibsonii]|uniref:DNA cytosine methyltransferase n=1 Tax=Kurthia gibsonii TaxID=33946 RepID=UPI002DB672C5|nr:DNA cytosine methyltransferase [Kurthia gibsonii]MEB6113914.1 DNA cytosine methyltransferase [Kurthia gibsonii]